MIDVLIRFLLSFPYHMTVHTLFLNVADYIPGIFPMNTFLVSFEVASKPSTMTIPFKYLAAILTGESVVITLPSSMLTITHRIIKKWRAGRIAFVAVW